MKTFCFAGTYSLETQRCDYCQKFESIKNIEIKLTAKEAEKLMLGKSPLYAKLGFVSMKLIVKD